MFKFSDSGSKCLKCADLWGFRALCVIFVGITIGWMGLQFVSTPPSVALLAESQKHTHQTGAILKQLESVENLVVELKRDVEEIKKQLLEGNKK